MNSRDLAEALPLEVLVADREDLVEQEHVRLDVGRDREAEPHVHPGRVRPDRQVDEALELGERDDLVHQLADARAREAVDRAVQVDVLAAGEVLVEPRAELEQRGDPAAGLDPAGRRPEDPRDELEQRGLAGAVAADEPYRLTRLGQKRHVPQSPDLPGRGAPARHEHVLERPLGVRGDAEALRHAVDDDPARRHVLITSPRVQSGLDALGATGAGAES